MQLKPRVHGSVYPSAPRVALVLGARAGVGMARIEAALRRQAADLRRAQGQRLAELRIARLGDQDPWGSTVGDRKLDAPIDGVVELTLADDADPAALVDLVKGAGQALSDAFDPARSTAVAGIVHRVRSAPGPCLMVMAGRRDPGCDAASFTRWWLTQHAPLALELCGEEMLCYEQLHGSDALCAATSQSAGLGGDAYNMYESNIFASLEGFLGRLSDPRVVQQVYEDEVGFLDHGGMRMAWTQQLEP